jgi:hypothetical protein
VNQERPGVNFPWAVHGLRPPCREPSMVPKDGALMLVSRMPLVYDNTEVRCGMIEGCGCVVRTHEECRVVCVRQSTSHGGRKEVAHSP